MNNCTKTNVLNDDYMIGKTNKKIPNKDKKTLKCLIVPFDKGKFNAANFWHLYASI